MTANAFLDWAIPTSFAVTGLILFVLLVRRPFARHFGAKAAYALWALPMVRLVMPAIPILRPETLAEPSNGTPVIYYSQATLTEPVSSPFDISAIVFGTWLVVGCFWLALQLWRQDRFKTALRRKSEPLSGSAAYLAAGLTDELELRRLPEIRISADQTGPLVTNLWRPMIILPFGFSDEYDQSQQRYILAHELAHIKRRDLWAALAVLIFRAFNWPNPLVHYAARYFRADQEAACDQFVITEFGDTSQTRSGYAETLIHAARTAVTPFSPQPLGLTIHHPLKERLMILKSQTKRSSKLRLAASTLAMGALLASAPYTAMADPDVPTPPAVPEVSSEHSEVSKRVVKWVESDGEATKKRHIEVEVKDGVTTAWEIDENGNKTQIPESDLEIFDAIEGKSGMKIMHGNKFPHLDGDKNAIIIKRMGVDSMNDEERAKFMEKLKSGDFPKSITVEKDMHFNFDSDKMTEEEKAKFMEKLKNNEHMTLFFEKHGEGDVQTFIKKLEDGKGMRTLHLSTDNDFEFEFHQEGSDAKAMVGIAKDMLENVDTNEVSSRARRKIQAAQRALRDAQRELEKE